MFRTLLLAAFFVSSFAAVAAPGNGHARSGKDHGVAAEASTETAVLRRARLQVQLSNALQLQPHQLCVLHHALLAQTEAPLPGEADISATSPTLGTAIAAVLRPEQVQLLAALPANTALMAACQALNVRP